MDGLVQHCWQGSLGVELLEAAAVVEKGDATKLKQQEGRAKLMKNAFLGERKRQK